MAETNPNTVANTSTPEFIDALMKMLSPLVLGLGNSLIGVARNTPQLANQFVTNLTGSQAIGSLAAQGVVKLGSTIIDTATGTSNQPIRTSDFFFGTTNSALNAYHTRLLQSAKGGGYDTASVDIATSAGNAAANALWENIYGANHGQQTSAAYRAYASLNRSIVESLHESLLPGFATAARVRGTADTPVELRETLSRVTEAYMTGAFGTAKGDDIATIITSLRSNVGGPSSGQDLVEATRSITKSLDNIRDFLGDNVSIDQLKQTLVAVTGSDLTITNRSVARQITDEMSYLNRRYGLDIESMTAASRSYQNYLGQFGIGAPVAGQIGLTIAGYAASHRSTNMFVSDAQLANEAGMNLSASAFSGELSDFAIDIAAAERLAGKSLTNEQKRRLAQAKTPADRQTLIMQYTGKQLGEVRSMQRALAGSNIARDEATKNVAVFQEGLEIAMHDDYTKRLTEIFTSFGIDRSKVGQYVEKARGLSPAQLEDFLIEQSRDPARATRAVRQLIASTGGEEKFAVMQSARSASQIGQRGADAELVSGVRHTAGSVAGVLQLLRSDSISKDKLRLLLDKYNLEDGKGNLDPIKLLEAAKKENISLSPDMQQVLSSGLTGRAFDFRDAQKVTTDGERRYADDKLGETIVSKLIPALTELTKVIRTRADGAKSKGVSLK